MTDRITETKNKHARELARIEREEHVRGLLPAPPDGTRWRIFGQSRETWAELEHIDRQGRLTLQHLDWMADALPDALPLALQRGSTTRILVQPRPFPDDERDDIQRIARVVVDYEGAASYAQESMAVRWWVSLTDGAMIYRVRVAIEILQPSAIPGLGRVEQERGGRWKRGPIKSSRLRMPSAMGQLLALEEDPQHPGHTRALAVSDRIAWYRPHGSPGKFLVYFNPLGDGDAGPAHLIHSIRMWQEDQR